MSPLSQGFIYKIGVIKIQILLCQVRSTNALMQASHPIIME